MLYFWKCSTKTVSILWYVSPARNTGRINSTTKSKRLILNCYFHPTHQSWNQFLYLTKLVVVNSTIIDEYKSLRPKINSTRCTKFFYLKEKQTETACIVTLCLVDIQIKQQDKPIHLSIYQMWNRQICTIYIALSVSLLVIRRVRYYMEIEHHSNFIFYVE